MMYGFNGDFRQRPVQSLRGASKNEMKDSLLKRTQEERQKREDVRLKIASAGKIQAFYRGFRVRKQLWGQLRENFDAKIKGKELKLDTASFQWCISKLCLFYRNALDRQRLIFICQELIKRKEEYLNSFGKDCAACVNQLRLLLKLVIRYIDSIASSSAAIAIPMRMLEIFLSSQTYGSAQWSEVLTGDQAVSYLLLNVVRNGYFDCLRTLLNHKVPSSLDKTSVPPSPVAESIFDLIMTPVSFAVSCSSNTEFKQEILHQVIKTFLCQQYTEQVAMFLLPAMAYGKYPFPFVELVQTLIHGVSPSSTTRVNSVHSGESRFLNGQQPKEGDTPWLLLSVLTLANKELDNLPPSMCSMYLRLLQRLLLQLPAGKHGSTMSSEESDSEDEDDDMNIEPDVTSLESVRSESLRLIDSRAHLKCLYTCLNQLAPSEIIDSLASISHCLLAYQRIAMHKIRLLYVLAFNPQFMRNLWNQCISSSAQSVTGSYTSLISMLANGVPMSEENVSRIVPLLTTFCCLFDHSLLTLDDTDFYGEVEAGKSSMPFSLAEMTDMCSTLRDTCLGIIELAHPDSRVALGTDYIQALQKSAESNARRTDDLQKATTLRWAQLFKAVSTLVRQLHNRDSRRPFCPFNHWLAPKVSIRTDRPAQIYESQNTIFRRRDFGSLASLTKTNADMDGPPLANRDVRNLVILTELPFVISFLDRVKILQSLLSVDKKEHQGDLVNFGLGSSINITIRRNFIYEDAFEKLSYENEPNLKKKMRIKLLNAAGLDEAGIDGGGIFREFLSELMKTGFEPNRGIFCYTADRLLYPNPESGLLFDNFTSHYFFLGRILGKALMENLMVEIPFASFFLTKILSPSNSSLDIHHLQSLDPLLYKNLLSLKHYEGDVADLGLDFSVVNSQFGENKVVDLKQNGRNIPVTDSNRIEYIHLMADYRINKQIRQHCNAFRMGMNEIIQLEWLQMFNSGELQVLVSGASVPIDLHDLRRETKYSGEFNDTHAVIEMFWIVLNDFSDHQKRQLLKFVTSCSRPPLLGFRDLFPAFCIHSAGPDDRLPTASTCMNLLRLPVFRDQETLKTKLLYAIESESGFELS